MSSQTNNTCTPSPRIWLVLSDKLGDNAQVEIIADALGLPYVTKRVYPLEQYVLGKPPFKASLYHIDKVRSDSLEPPWPDLILTIGRRSAMVAMWIREQSGGRTRVVLVGRPKRDLDQYALIIAPSQYHLPDRPNVLRLDLPLMRPDEAAIGKAVTLWRERFSTMQRPMFALMVGGATKPFVFDEKVARELTARAAALAASAGGTLYVTTSRRTPPAVVEAIKAALPEHSQFYQWRKDGKDNPYLALLGLADYFIVTGDSVSMMVEVARLGRPLAIFSLPVRDGFASRFQQWISSPKIGKYNRILSRLIVSAISRLGILGYTRDLTALHRVLVDRGLAVPFGKPFPIAGERALDELPLVAARVRKLLDEENA